MARQIDTASSATQQQRAQQSTSIGVYALLAAGMVLFSAFMLYGMKRVSGVVGSIVMSTTPAVTAIASILFLHDKLNWHKALAITLAVAGVLLVNLGGGQGDSGGGNQLLGSLLVFGAVCCWVSHSPGFTWPGLRWCSAVCC